MKNTERFSNRVDNYVKYRPTYPAEILGVLREAGWVKNGCVAADIGSGTGKWTQILLQAGIRTFAVEPNEPMRKQAEAIFGSNGNFVSVNGTAEATGLSDASVDFITVAQAFHWFDVEKTRAEFRRILNFSRGAGGAALIWNDRALTPGFMTEFHELLRKHSAEYRARKYPQIEPEAITRFFSPGGFVTTRLPFEQAMDFEALKGRVLSSSYIPTDETSMEAIETDLRSLFSRHEKGGMVVMEYFTEMFHGSLG